MRLTHHLAALLLVGASGVDSFGVSPFSNKKPAVLKASAPSLSSCSSLAAVIYMPDGEVIQDDERDDIDWKKPTPATRSSEGGGGASAPSDVLLNHLNGPDMRGPLAVLAAANDNIDLATIEHVAVKSVTATAIDIEAVCSSGGVDEHCVNVLSRIDFPPNCKTDTDGDILDALGVLYREADAVLERRRVKAGIVISFNPSRGYGFIVLDGAASEDVYVHQSNIKMDGYRLLRKGERVEFKMGIDTRRGTGRPYAFDVTPLERGGGEGSGGAASEGANMATELQATAVGQEAAPDTLDSSIGDLVDLSIPYDAAARLAYKSSDKSSMEYGAFRARYEEDAVANVVAKKQMARKAETGEAKAVQATADAEALRINKEEATAAEEKVTVAAKEEEEEEAESADLLGSNTVETAQASAERYASIEDLEERAFRILLDLGMVTPTPDPNSPDYDTSMDDELAPENVFLNV